MIYFIVEPKQVKAELTILPKVLVPDEFVVMPDELKIMEIKVIKSQQFAESYNPHIGCYLAKSKTKGICLFFNNIEFVNPEDKKREGAEVDQENLKKLFEQIGIDFRPHVNKTKKVIFHYSSKTYDWKIINRYMNFIGTWEHFGRIY